MILCTPVQIYIMVKYCVCQLYTRAQVLDVYDMELRPNLHALVGTELWLKECKANFASRYYLSVSSGIDFVFYKQARQKSHGKHVKLKFW